jgi:thymidylate synthase (FAD)
MITVKPSFVIETPIDGEFIIRHIEKCAKTCYKTEHIIGGFENAKMFVKNLIKRQHHSTLEHISISVRIICDRGVAGELVRHRIASFSQESTRYCNYVKKGIQIIHPSNLTKQQKIRREDHFWTVQDLYDLEIAEGIKPEIARGVLPLALKTEIVVSANLREWRHMFDLRVTGTTGKPHPQIKEIMEKILHEFRERIPVIFD